MQYVRSISGSVSKTWNSINPATLSGAIDVIVVEHEDGSLSCSPFHVRFGKFSLLRPSEKKVEFQVNNVKQDYAMKLGEGGEAFFVFETTADVPENLQTSPLVSPVASPEAKPATPPLGPIHDPEHLDLDEVGNSLESTRPKSALGTMPMVIPERRAQSDIGMASSISANQAANKLSCLGEFALSQSFPDDQVSIPAARNRANTTNEIGLSVQFPPEQVAPQRPQSETPESKADRRVVERFPSADDVNMADLPKSNPEQQPKEAVNRAINLSKKLWGSNIASHVTDNGDLMLDMTGYKSTEEEMLQAELIARKILSEEFEGNYDIGSLISPDEKGNLWIYSSEESKEAATRKTGLSGLAPEALVSTDALSDPGYHSDDMGSQKSVDIIGHRERAESDSAVGLTTPPHSPNSEAVAEPSRNYAKTLRLTSDQLKALDLKPGANPMSFSVNRATCQAYMFLWKHEVPIVISDIDGTITKSDALGHVLNMIGRDWTHLGVAKLYTDIVANGYNILYLTSRSVGQADTTRAYISGIIQEGYKLPKGPVIMSPDRTMAALRREIYLRKPEVFKMACLRDIMGLFNQRKTPFYAGFGNRLTDALSYRSVNIPSTRIFTINSNAEVSLDLMSLSRYKTGYGSMREIVDHFFPPVGMLVQEGGEQFTDFNYWRDTPLDLDDISESESDEDDRLTRIMSEDENDYDVFSEDLNESYISRESMEDSLNQMVRQSIESENARNIIRISSNEIEVEVSDEDEGDDLDALDLVAEAAADRSGTRRSGIKNLQRELDRNRGEESGIGRNRGKSSTPRR